VGNKGINENVILKLMDRREQETGKDFTFMVPCIINDKIE
jgi:hypothetical protein